jgi:hypothetical protein
VARVLLALSLLAVAGCGREAPPPDVPRIGRFPADRFFVQKDVFLSVDEPALVSAREATFLRDDDQVFGIVVKGRARAYPTTMLAYHHVVNDVIEGIPVAVTY